MSTVIGLLSGKEFVVRERFYPFFDKKTGAQTTIFFSEDEKRVITIPPTGSHIEFYDEPLTEDIVKQFDSIAESVAVPEAGHDPNVG